MASGKVPDSSRGRLPALLLPALLLALAVAPGPALADEAEEEGGGLRLEADRIETLGEGRVRALGSPRIRFPSGELSADEIEVSEPDREIRASGNVILRDGLGNVVRGEDLRFDFGERAGTLSPADASAGEDGRVRFGGASADVAGDRYTLSDAYYTTCPADMEVWKVVADHFVLDAAGEVARMEGVRLRVGGVPVLYLPFMSVSTDRETRRTGFLAPNLEQRSGRYGLRTPFYVNLAPNYDATIEPVLAPENGVFLEGEFRYLQRRHEGVARAGLAPNDRGYGGRSRSAIRLDHAGRGPGGLRWGVEAMRVSDDDYLRDYSDDTDLIAERNLPLLAFVEGEGESWQARAEVEHFQHIRDDTESPYDVLPRARLGYADDFGGVGVSSTTEIANFRAKETGRVEGLRLRESVRVSRAFGPLVPAVGLDLARYSLDDSGPDNSPGYAVPFLTVDSALTLSRRGPLFDREVEQTLEPRLLYAYAPERGFSGHPNFDTAIADTNYTGLYSRRRFVGGDRVSDANFVSYGVTSRLWDTADGRELGNMSLVQRFHFDRPDVLLPAENAGGGPVSDLYVSANLSPARWLDLAARLEWNPDRSEVDRVELEGQARGGGDKVLNVAFLDIREDTDDSDSDMRIQALFPLGRNASGVLTADYSLEENHLSKGVAGLEHEGDCRCWRVAFLVERYVESEGNNDTSLFFRVDLLGLGGFGDNDFRAERREIRDFW